MRIGVAGAGGRMGQVLVRAVLERDGLTLAGANERAGSPHIGADAAALAGLAAAGVTVGEGAAPFEGCDAVLDFTSGAASADLARGLSARGVAHIIGSTGFSADDEAAIATAAERIAIVKSGNMSLGVNLLAVLVRQAAKALPQADIEVLEMHHRRKVDAPSGTALLLGDAAAAGRDVALDDVALYAREGHTGPRADGAIGFATLRGGTVIGEHEIILALDGERLRLGHIGETRAIYANGAIAAALWCEGRAPGLYTMAHVLGLG